MTTFRERLNELNRRHPLVVAIVAIGVCDVALGVVVFCAGAFA